MTQPPATVPPGDLVDLMDRGLVPLPFTKETYLTGATVAGTSHVPGIRDLMEGLSIGDRVVLVREPGNPYDQLAIRVNTKNGAKLGYVPRKVNNRTLARLMDAGKMLYGVVTEIDPDAVPPHIRIGIYMHD